jgi:hypothetical protein
MGKNAYGNYLMNKIQDFTTSTKFCYYSNIYLTNMRLGKNKKNFSKVRKGAKKKLESFFLKKNGGI